MNRARRMLVITAAILFSFAPTNAAMIEEISVDSVNATYIASGGELQFEQYNATIVREWSDSTQTAVTDSYFRLTTYLTADNSSSGVATAEFAGGTIEITNGVAITYLTANVNTLIMQEVTTLGVPFSMFVGYGTFTVTGGTWQPDLTWTEGQVLDLTWIMSGDINDFQNDFFNGEIDESDLTLIAAPEPATMALLGLGLPAVLARRRRSQIRRGGK